MSRREVAVVAGLFACVLAMPACTRSGFNAAVFPGADAWVTDAAKVGETHAHDVGARDASDVQMSDAASSNPFLGTFKISPSTLLANVSSAADEISPTLSADGLTLYFGRRDHSGKVPKDELYSATRPDLFSPFDHPLPLTSLNTTTYSENKMSVSSDGLVAYVTADWPGGSGDFDLWEIRRKSLSVPFDRNVAVNLASLNGKNADWDPFITAQGLCLYYSVAIYAGGPGDNELMVTCRPGLSSYFQAGKQLSTINTVEGEGNPSLTEDGLVLVFNRVGANSDIMYATRATKNASFTVRGVLPMVKAKADRTEPFIRRDGREIFFCVPGSGVTEERDIYHAMIASELP